MWLLAGAIALDLIRLTGLNHEKIDVNPSQVVKLQPKPEVSQGHFTAAVKCVVYTSDGKFIPVLEDCNTVNKLLRAAE